MALLPYSSKTLVRDVPMMIKVLQLLEMAITELIASIDAFSYGRLSEFDAHVGECACQIRAYKIFVLYEESKKNNGFLELFQKKKRLFELLREIKNYAKTLEEIRYKKRDRSAGRPEVMSIISFLKNKKLFFTLDEELLFLTQCHFLSKYKKFYNAEPAIDYAKIKESLNMSKDVSRRLVHLYQVSVSNLSCDFILTLVASCNNISYLEPLVRILKKSDDDERSVLPCFLVMYVMLHHMDLIKRRIIVENEFDHNIFLDKRITYSDDDPCVVLRCYYQGLISPDYEKRFNQDIEKYGLESVILYNMAAHPQYPGEKLSVYKSDPFSSLAQELSLNKDVSAFIDTFVMMKCFSEGQGYLSKNFRLPFIRHIYCDLTKNMSSVKNTPVFQRPETALSLQIGADL